MSSLKDIVHTSGKLIHRRVEAPTPIPAARAWVAPRRNFGLVPAVGWLVHQARLQKSEASSHQPLAAPPQLNIL
jgi:hypothetical protein